MKTHVVVIGAGPAGLTAAYLLSKENIAVTVLESDPELVGGIARTVTYKDYCFDIGGHRFFSKSKEIEALWTELLPNDMLARPRSSRILYRGKFYSYPLKPIEALRKLGFWESLRCGFSYLHAQLFPVKSPISFSQWVENRFGKRLFSIFFKTYTEKVWGMKCSDISSDWAAQRIKGLSLWSAVMSAFLPKRKQRDASTIKTLIDHFRYPRKGPGMLWEACKQKIIQQQGQVWLGCTAEKIYFNKHTQGWQVQYKTNKNEQHQLEATHVISSAPLRELVTQYLINDIPAQAMQAAQQLRYRDFLIVVLIVRERHVFSDNWIYIHDEHVEVARIQNFKSWSPEMVPDHATTCYGMEYFCFKDDSLWVASDADLIAKATAEIVQLKLAKREDILDGCVIRQPKAYPVYDHAYQQHVQTIKEVLASQFNNLYVVGRNGMHKYNNQDHSMMTALLTTKNILAETQLYDIWRVNQDAEYLEAGLIGETALRDVPQPV